MMKRTASICKMKCKKKNNNNLLINLIVNCKQQMKNWKVSDIDIHTKETEFHLSFIFLFFVLFMFFFCLFYSVLFLLITEFVLTCDNALSFSLFHLCQCLFCLKIFNSRHSPRSVIPFLFTDAQIEEFINEFTNLILYKFLFGNSYFCFFFLFFFFYFTSVLSFMFSTRRWTSFCETC